MTRSRRFWIDLVLGLVVGGVFVYASLEKIQKPPEFARIVYHYQVIGPSATIPPLVPNLVAVILPWVELLIGLGLILGVLRRESAAIAAVLLLVFVAAVGSALHRGIDIENCGCFTVTGEGRKAGLKLVLSDLGLLAASLVLLRPRALTSSGRAA
jgi:uncharacterized membrane protein YphA (DoxX/SURF4 family)